MDSRYGFDFGRSFFDKKFDKPYFAHVPAAVAGTDFAHSIVHSPEETRMKCPPEPLVRPEEVDNFVLDLTISIGKKTVVFDYTGITRLVIERGSCEECFAVDGIQLPDGVLHLVISSQSIVMDCRDYSDEDSEALLASGPFGNLLAEHFRDLIEAYETMPDEEQVSEIAIVAVSEALYVYQKNGEEQWQCKRPTMDQLEGLVFLIGCSECDFPEGVDYARVGDVLIRVENRDGHLVAIVGQLPCRNVFAERFHKDLARRLSEFPVTFVQDAITEFLIQDGKARRRLGREIAALLKVSRLTVEQLERLLNEEEASELPSAWSSADKQSDIPPARGGGILRIQANEWPSDGSSDDN